MTISLKHPKTSTEPDDGDASLIQPSDWNAGHDLSLAGPALIGRATAGAGAAQEITLGTGLALSAGGVLSVDTDALIAAMGIAVTALNTITPADAQLITVTDPTTGTEYKVALSALKTYTGGTAPAPAPAPADSTAPAWSGSTISTSNMSSTGVTVAWPTATDASGSVSYRWRLGAGSWTTTTSTSANISGQDAGATLAFEVQAFDATPNYSSSLTQSITLTQPADAVAPTWGAGADIAITDLGTTSYTAAWPAASDNVAVTGYRWRINSGAWTTTTSTSAPITGRTPGATDTFEVQAQDATPNWSASLSKSVTLQADLPGAPVLSPGTATDTTQPLTWTAPAANGSAITDYIVQYRTTGSGTWNTFADGTSATSGATVNSLAATTSYEYRVAAVNSVGQGAWSNTATGSTTAAVTAYTITGYSGNAVKSTIDASGITASGGFKGINPSGTGQTTVNPYWSINATSGGAQPASAKSGWGTSPTVPPAEITQTQNGSSGGYNNGMTPMTKATAFTNNGYLWVPAGSGTTTWYFWVKPVDGAAQCMNPSGTTVTGG